jgi:large subunit ribosomal protein L21
MSKYGTVPKALHPCLPRIQGSRMQESKEKVDTMFAVIKNGGRQYKVSAGDRLEVNRMAVEIGKQVQFNEVLLISDAGTTMVGSPLVENAMVLATATSHARGKKLIVFRYKSKKRFRHKRGHRQELTVFTIDDIVANGKSLLTGEAPLFEEEGQAPGAEVAAAEEAPVVQEAVESGAEAEAPTIAGAEAEAEGEKKTTRRRRTRKVEETEGQGEE